MIAADESAEPTMVEESPAMAVMPIVLELIQEALLKDWLRGLIHRQLLHLDFSSAPFPVRFSWT